MQDLDTKLLIALRDLQHTRDEIRQLQASEAKLRKSVIDMCEYPSTVVDLGIAQIVPSPGRVTVPSSNIPLLRALLGDRVDSLLKYGDSFWTIRSIVVNAIEALLRERGIED